MVCAFCGSEWWTERRDIKPAAGPASDPRMQTAAREYRYLLVCAECGTGSDQEKNKPRGARKKKVS